MNKKVLTLCAAMLLTGSLATIDAKQVLPAETPGIEVVKTAEGAKVIYFTKDVTLEDGDYLMIEEDNVTIDGYYNYARHTLNGRLVIKGEGVTVKNLDINNIVKINKGSYTKNAITVVASEVTLLNNIITCGVAEKGAEDDAMANGIVIFPTKTAVKYNVAGNTIKSAKDVAGTDNSASSGLIVAENTTSTVDEELSASTITSETIAKFNLASVTGNTFEDCAIDYVYEAWNGGHSVSNICVTPLKGDDELTADVIKDNIGIAKNFEFKGSAEKFMELAGNNKPSGALAVVCSDFNVLYDGATNPDNGNPAYFAEKITPAQKEVFGCKLLEKAAFNTNTYYLLILSSSNGTPYAIVENAAGKFEAVPLTSQAEMDKYLKNPKALWKATEGKDPRNTDNWIYTFTNKEGHKLVAGSGAGTGSDGVFEPKGNACYNNGVVFEVNNTDLNSASPAYFGLYKTADNYFTGNELIKRYGDYFTLGITYKDDKNKDVDVTGEFKGQLRPVKSVSYNNGEATYKDAEDNDKFMLVNEEGNIIVIDTKAPLFEAPSDHGYAFTTITPKQWTEWLNTASLQTKYNYVTKFKLAYDYNNLSTTEAVTSIEIEGYTVGLEKKEGNIILVADVERQLLDDPTISIKLNAGNGIAAKDWLTSPSYYTVEAINKDKKAPHYGKVLGLNEDGLIDWVAPENVDLTKPEGQFAIDPDYTFRNRENRRSTSSILDGELYKVAGEKDVYALVHPNSDAGIDTLRITPITADKYTSADGFKRFTASELNANTYTVAMKSLMGDPFIIENHNDKHRLGLSADEYTAWRIEMPTVKLLDATDDFTRMVADTVKVLTRIRYFVDGDWHWTQTSNPDEKYYYPNTELQICTYVLKNTDNGEYLDGQDYTESAGNAYYVCNADKKTATRIAFKMNGEGTVNLVPAYGYYEYKISNNYYDTQDWMTGMIMNEVEGDSPTKYVNYVEDLYLSDNKIIGGTSASTGVLKDENLYKATTNDLFVIAPAEAPTYKKLAQDDKIILTLKENAKDEYVLFEDGDFAGMGNRLAHKDINPTLYVDTAYVNRVGNYAYQYLLSVRPTRIDTTYQCNLPEEHGVHHADTTKGFFLVNMVDSAKANQNVHNNKFMYDGEYKLAFVEGYHTNDSLFFTEEGKVVSKMEVGNGDFNIAKYAFKMVDETENEFVIETAAGYNKKYNYVKDNNGHWHWTVASVESKPGYLRWVNDNLVVTEDIDKAAIFTMEASDKEATANEEISAGNVVVAGVDGAVVVKGAEGKNVIVSTILGKVVANEVVSSDNATIAAPAGIVVVSVDGESFKVVVK